MTKLQIQREKENEFFFHYLSILNREDVQHTYWSMYLNVFFLILWLNFFQHKTHSRQFSLTKKKLQRNKLESEYLGYT